MTSFRNSLIWSSEPVAANSLRKISLPEARSAASLMCFLKYSTCRELVRIAINSVGHLGSTHVFGTVIPVDVDAVDGAV